MNSKNYFLKLMCVHRQQAMSLIREAIDEVNAGIEYDPAS